MGKKRKENQNNREQEGTRWKRKKQWGGGAGEEMPFPFCAVLTSWIMFMFSVLGGEIKYTIGGKGNEPN